VLKHSLRFSSFAVIAVFVLLVISFAVIWYQLSNNEDTVTIEQSYDLGFAGSQPYPERCDVHGEKLEKDNCFIGGSAVNSSHRLRRLHR
jgi:hypothetical protein